MHIQNILPFEVKNPKPVCSYATLKSCVTKNAGIYNINWLEKKLFWLFLLLEFFRRLHSSKARKTVHCHCMDSCFNSIVVVKSVEVRLLSDLEATI